MVGEMLAGKIFVGPTVRRLGLKAAIAENELITRALNTAQTIFQPLDNSWSVVQAGWRPATSQGNLATTTADSTVSAVIVDKLPNAVSSMRAMAIGIAIPVGSHFSSRRRTGHREEFNRIRIYEDAMRRFQNTTMKNLQALAFPATGGQMKHWTICTTQCPCYRLALLTARERRADSSMVNSEQHSRIKLDIRTVAVTSELPVIQTAEATVTIEATFATE